MSQTHSVGTIGRSTLWSILNQIVGQFLVLAVFLITARFVSKEAFGIMATCMLTVELFRQVLIESIGTTFYAKKSPTDDDYNSGFYIIAITGTVSALAVFLLAKPAAALFHHPDIAPSLQWISAILLTMGLSKMHEIWLTKHLQFKALALRSITAICLGGGIGIVMAIKGMGIASLITQQIVTALASLVWLWLASPWRPHFFKVQKSSLLEILRYWKFVAANSIAALISGQSDVFFSSYYLGPVATGVYNAAKRLLLAATLISGSGLNSVALPTLTSLSSDPKRFQASFLTCISITTLVTAPMFAGLAALSSDLIHLLLGSKWDDVAPVLSVLTLSGFLNSLGQYSSNILLIKHKAHWQTVIGFLSALTNVILLAILTQYGILALAIALTFRVLIFVPIVTGLALHLLNLKVLNYIKVVFLPITFAVVMAISVAYLRLLLGFSSMVNLLLFIPFGTILYFGLFYIFDRATLINAFTMLRETLDRRSVNKKPVLPEDIDPASLN